jgi:predicted small secreted protein
MKNKKKILGIALIAVIGFTMAACNKSGSSGSANAQSGGKSLNSAEALREYLDKQPANSPDKPIKVTMNANAPMLEGIAKVIASSGKYVSLNLPGDVLTNIPYDAFLNCKTLVGITIPNSVTSIGDYAFLVSKLTSVTFEGTITPDSLNSDAFGPRNSLGDLCNKYLAGGIGTYTRPDDNSRTWTKK